MHGYRDGDKARIIDCFVGKRFDGGINAHGDISRLLKQCGELGQMKRLVSQFVAGDQQNAAG
jgi:hypothetical protein